MTALDRELRDVIRAVVLEVLAEQKPATSGMVTIAAYAKAWSLSVSTVRRAIRDGRLPATKVGRGIRVPAGAELGQRVAVATSPTTVAAHRVLQIVNGSKP